MIIFALVSIAMALAWTVLQPDKSESSRIISAVCSTLWYISALYFLSKVL